MFKDIIVVACGGAMGSALRYLIGRLCGFMPFSVFPLATFAVNLLGCFLIGLLFGLTERHNLLSQTQSLLLITGFCGGLTTFSTFANDIVSLSSRGETLTSILYLLLSITLGLLMLSLGRLLAR